MFPRSNLVPGFFVRVRITRMKLRKLRIAWSVIWGVLCLLLIVLWVRSYTWEEAVYRDGLTRSLGLISTRGIIVFMTEPGENEGWQVSSVPAPFYKAWNDVALVDWQEPPIQIVVRHFVVVAF